MARIKKGVVAQSCDAVDELHRFLRNKKYVEAAGVLDNGLDINHSNGFFHALNLCILAADADAVDFLLANGADVNYPDACGMMPLSRAVEIKSAFMVRFLLERGAKPNTMDGQFTDTPLFGAARDGLDEIIDVLFEYGVKIDQPQEKYSLSVAVRNRHTSTCKKLLEHGCDPNFAHVPSRGSHAYGHVQYTPLGHAARNNDVEIAKMLLEQGADPNVPSVFPLFPLNVAASHGNTEAAVLLIRHGAKVDLDGGIHSAFTWARKNGHMKTVQAMIEANTQPLSVMILYELWVSFIRTENRPLMDLLASKKQLFQNDDLVEFDAWTKRNVSDFYPVDSVNYARKKMALEPI